MTLVPPEVQAAQGLRLADHDHDKITARAVAGICEHALLVRLEARPDQDGGADHA